MTTNRKHTAISAVTNEQILRLAARSGADREPTESNVLNFARDLLAVASAAPENGDGRDAERGHWNPVYNTDPVQRACGELPEGWEIEILLERGAGCVYLIDPNGERCDIDNADKFDWTIQEAIDAALSPKAGD
ncbi:hypothetical protein [Paraburkholderia caledonica]|uniref:hypothetical protein n=1 Tax=Paraburkholderia caledonica TaxID=134536 RepID=UPI0038BA842F